jgi:hypothetical protein
MKAKYENWKAPAKGETFSEEVQEAWGIEPTREAQQKKDEETGPSKRPFGSGQKSSLSDRIKRR